MTDREYWRGYFTASMKKHVAEWRKFKGWDAFRANTARNWVYHYGKMKRKLS